MPHWRLVCLCLVLSAATAAAVSGYALAVNAMTERMETGGLEVIWLAPAIILPLVAFRSLTLWWQTLATNRLALAVMRDLQSAMYSALVRADFARLQKEAVGSIVSRFTNDVTMLREALVRSANNLMRDSLQAVGAIAVMLWLDWVLALLLIVVLPVAGQPVLKLGKAIRRRSTSVQAQMGDVTSFLEESMGGARMVKTFALEDYADRKAKAAFHERFRLYLSMIGARARIEPIMEMAGGVALAAIFAVAGWRIAEGEMSVAALLGIIAALLVASPALRALGGLSGVIQEGLAVIDRIFAVLDETPDVVDAPGAAPLAVKAGEIRFEGVEFGYEAGASALDHVDMVVAAGSTVALVGPSGSGKTTLLNLIPRLYDPRGGRVLIDGQDIRQATLASLRASVSLVSQDVTLFDDTIRANIALGRLDASDDEIEAAAKAADAHDFITGLPGGYDAPVGQRGSALSGGQRQRIAIARAILKDAPILLLDEATSALDAQSEARVQAAVERLSEGRTTLVIAHRLSTVRKADLICVMQSGRIVETGTHDQLTARGGLYADLARLQLRETPET